jgi:hypothetical protein
VVFVAVDIIPSSLPHPAYCARTERDVSLTLLLLLAGKL